MNKYNQDRKEILILTNMKINIIFLCIKIHTIINKYNNFHLKKIYKIILLKRIFIRIPHKRIFIKILLKRIFNKIL